MQYPNDLSAKPSAEREPSSRTARFASALILALTVSGCNYLSDNTVRLENDAVKDQELAEFPAILPESVMEEAVADHLQGSE